MGAVEQVSSVAGAPGLCFAMYLLYSSRRLRAASLVVLHLTHLPCPPMVPLADKSVQIQHSYLTALGFLCPSS